LGRYPYIDQAGDQSQKGGYQESCQTEIVRYKRNAEVFFFKNHCKEKNQAVARLTEPFRLEMKKAHLRLRRFEFRVSSFEFSWKFLVSRFKFLVLQNQELGTRNQKLTIRASHLRPF
jgi:hypothetical protein